MKKIIIIICLLTFISVPFISDAGLHFGMPSAVKSTVKELDRKVSESSRDGDSIMSMQSTGITNENGELTTRVGYDYVKFRFIDEATGSPISGLSVGYALDTDTKDQGIMMIIDPYDQYSPQIVIMKAGGSSTSSMRKIPRRTTGLEAASIDLMDIFLPQGPSSTISEVVLTKLPKSVQTVGNVLGLVDAAGIVAKALDQAGLPLSEYAGELSYAEKETLTKEEAMQELKDNLTGSIKNKLFFFMGNCKAKIPSVQNVMIDLLSLGLDANVIMNCGDLAGQQITVTTINGFKFYDCETVQLGDTEGLVRVATEAVDQYGQPLSSGSLSLISTGNLGLAFEVNFDTAGKTSVNVPTGTYKSYIRSPGSAVDVSSGVLVTGATTFPKKTLQEPPVATITLTSDPGLTGFLEPGTEIQFSIAAEDKEGSPVACSNPVFIVTNPVGSIVATIDPETGLLTIRNDDGAVKVTARCGGVTSNAILVSGTGEDTGGNGGIFTEFDGTWLGTYNLTVNDAVSGCVFEHSGNMTVILSGSIGTFEITGVQVLEVPGCALKEIMTVSENLSSITISGNIITAYADEVYIQGTLSGSILSGTLTLADGAGSFSLTKQP